MTAKEESPNMNESPDKAPLPYTAITVSNYRGIPNLHVPKLGRINLITGKNNAGKTALLEAIRLHAEKGSPQALHDILSSHEEDLDAPAPEAGNTTNNRLEAAYNLFHGFPDNHQDAKTIRIAAHQGEQTDTLTIRPAWTSPGSQKDPNKPRERPALAVETAEGSITHPLYDLSGNRQGPICVPTPCIVIRQQTRAGTNILTHLWDKITSTKEKDLILQAVRSIEPRITDIDMTESTGNPMDKAATAQAHDMRQPVRLRSFGESVSRIFTIALSFMAAKDGVLLIDQIENGLHYSVQTDVWKNIGQLTQQLNVQVFVTSQSWDIIEAVHAASEHLPEDHFLIRLTRFRNNVIQSTFTGPAIAAITKQNMKEVR